YSLEIQKCQIINTRNGSPAFIADLKVLTGDSDIGATRNWFVDLYKDSAMGNVKAFLLAALGVDWSNERHRAEGNAKIVPEIEKLAEAAVSADQYLRGKKVNVNVVKVATRSGGEFSRHDWSPAA